MRIGRLVVAALIASTGLSQAARACEIDTYLVQLPGESVEDAKARSSRFDEAYWIRRALEREINAFSKAKVAYLARVVSEGERSHAPFSAVVHPVASLKGALPKSDRTLSDIPAGGLCVHRGDGDGALGKVGEPVVVFEGLPQSPDYYPRGIESFRTKYLRSEEVLDALAKFGKDLED